MIATNLLDSNHNGWCEAVRGHDDGGYDPTCQNHDHIYANSNGLHSETCEKKSYFRSQTLERESLSARSNVTSTFYESKTLQEAEISGKTADLLLGTTNMIDTMRENVF